MRKLTVLLTVLFLLLLPSRPASAQSYSSTDSSLVYNTTYNRLEMSSEWFHSIGSGVNWYFWNCRYELTISVYTSQSNYDNGIAQSTNITTYYVDPYSFGQGAYSPGVGRVYGYRYATLQQGYIYSLSMLPKVDGSHQIGGNPPTYFTWPSVTRTLVVDLIHPGDG